MAEAARITHLLLPSLKLPLQTTQLILIHSQPIAISFRKDERKFDVEGSYNIRYEVIKKRLDKVRIKGHRRKVNPTGKNSHSLFKPKRSSRIPRIHRVSEKQKHIEANVEFLELEELQGVTGMKALRVDINIV
jgi:hypothetical protein